MLTFVFPFSMLPYPQAPRSALDFLGDGTMRHAAIFTAAAPGEVVLFYEIYQIVMT
jgi:hypothetical protein